MFVSHPFAGYPPVVVLVFLRERMLFTTLLWQCTCSMDLGNTVVPSVNKKLGVFLAMDS